MKFSSLRTVSQVSIGGGVLLFIILLILVVSYSQLHVVETVAKQISSLRTPTVNASYALKNSINTALADLRGWMLLEDSQFVVARKASWESIRNAQNQLKILSKNWANPESVMRLREVDILLDKLEASQQKVELLAWHDSNLPATQLLFSQAAPRAELIFETITKLMEAEYYIPTTPERKRLYSAMANFRGSFAISLAHIRAFLISAEPIYKKKFNISWQENSISYEVFDKTELLFNENQQKIFSVLAKTRKEFAQLPAQLFALRDRGDWNLANYELKQVAVPISKNLSDLLSEMSENQTQLLVADMTRSEVTLIEYRQILFWLSMLAMGTAFGVALSTASLNAGLIELKSGKPKEKVAFSPDTKP